MSLGTRPLGWLFNFFSRQPQGNPYELLQSIQPIVDASQDWPIDLKQYTQQIVAIAGNNTIDFIEPNDKHRLWVNMSVSSGNATVLNPAVAGQLAVSLIIAGQPLAPFVAYFRLSNVGYLPNELVPILGRVWGGSAQFQGASAGSQLLHNRGNVYQPPGSTLRVLLTQQTAGDVINLRGLYLERDQNAPLAWPF